MRALPIPVPIDRCSTCRSSSDLCVADSFAVNQGNHEPGPVAGQLLLQPFDGKRLADVVSHATWIVVVAERFDERSPTQIREQVCICGSSSPNRNTIGFGVRDSKFGV
jgi:hypothetical protein